MRRQGLPDHPLPREHRLRETPVRPYLKGNAKGKLATKRHEVLEIAGSKLLHCLWPIFRILPFVFLEQERGVGAAKTEGVRKRVADVGLTRLVRHVIEVAVRIRYFVVDGGRNDTALDNK